MNDKAEIDAKSEPLGVDVANVQHDFVFDCRRLFLSVTAISGESSAV